MMLYNRNLYNFIWARYTCQRTVCWKIAYIWAPNKPFRYTEVQKEATNITSETTILYKYWRIWDLFILNIYNILVVFIASIKFGHLILYVHICCIYVSIFMQFLYDEVPECPRDDKTSHLYPNLPRTNSNQEI